MNFLTVLGSFIITIASLVLAIFACFGSISKGAPLDKIYVAQLDITGVNISSVLGTTISTSSVPSFDSLGIPSYLNLGLWSYCIAGSNQTVTSCTKPSGIEQFNLKTMLEDNIDNNQVSELVSSVISIVVPEKLSDKMSYYNALIKCMCITLVVGIALLALTVIVNVLRWVLHFTFVNVIGRILSILSFISIGISAGTGTATYVVIRNILSDNYSEYGIKLSLGRKFYALIWASVAGCLINFILWILTRQRRKAQVIMQPVPTEKF
ncbi:unnamed protein product [Kluyveromyces dobzhanskii CBS 2104]|uniref:WGS project CCBQ000000000 data, contig 00016 n=1 Tax=Kluyveromyces dobzhanskii CBS 2104 TaxID=1427455 RepID=A0A0A8L1X7_9SACH|nr:unnamed protein product [Kluyveromyces dobzhanskii CBS 2104]